MNYEATSLFKSYWRGDSKWPCFKAILYSYLYDLIGIGGELSSLTMIFWITPNNPDFCLQWDWKNLWNFELFCQYFLLIFLWSKKKIVDKNLLQWNHKFICFHKCEIHSWISISTNIHHAVFQPMFCNITSLESSFSHCVHSFLLMLCDYYWFFQSSNYKVMMKAIKKFFYNVMFNVLMGDN